jgi:hypothetical protein
MDLTPRQQKMIFVVIVVALALLGVYLILPNALGSRRASSAGTPAPSATGPAAPAVTPAGTPSALPPAQPSAVPAPSPSSSANIYQWLPFTQSDLASAAAVVTKFAAYFDTFSYTDSPNAYTARMAGLVTSQLAATLQADYSTYGVAKQRTQQKEVSSATATINQLRSFGPSSMTFVVTIDQKTNLAGQSPASQQWAVTVARSGTSWQASGIQPASAGNS